MLTWAIMVMVTITSVDGNTVTKQTVEFEQSYGSGRLCRASWDSAVKKVARDIYRKVIHVPDGSREPINLDAKCEPRMLG